MPTNTNSNLNLIFYGKIMRIASTLLLSFLLLGCSTDNVAFSTGNSGSHRIGSQCVQH